VALGTAVRSRGGHRPARTFTTDLAGQELAKLLSSGWVPAGIVVGLHAAVAHDGWLVRRQTRRLAGNAEVTASTELINHVRAGARDEFAAKAARLGADGVLMSDARWHVRRLEPADGHVDHAGECLLTGNAIVQFRAGDRPAAGKLTVLPLRDHRSPILPGRRVPRWRRRGMTEQ
jgi:hypothetical protein